MRGLAFRLVVGFLYVAQGCGDDDGGSGGVDSGTSIDAGSRDSGTRPDAGGGLDAGTTDDAATDGSADGSSDAAPDGAVDGSTDASVDGSVPGMVDVTLAMATASHSQSSYGVAETIDGNNGTANDGWAIDPMQGTDQTAVWETVEATPSYGTGTQLTFTMSFQTLAGYFLGKFRLSATTADRSMFADGMASSGDLGLEEIWTTLTPSSVTADNGSELTVEAEDVVYVDYGAPDMTEGSYTVIVDTYLEGITGIRLEALTDARLPNADGPGYSGNGNFVLSEIEVSADASSGPIAIPLAEATATHSQTSYSVADTINGTVGGGSDGWAIDPMQGTDQTAVWETVTDLPAYSGGTRITFTLSHRTLSSYLLGKFRLSATTADRSMFADGLASSGAVGAAGIWTTLTPTTVSADNGSDLMVEANDIVYVDYGAGDGDQADYTVVVETTTVGITGFRLEALTDARLPSNDGPGYSGNGNFVLSEVGVVVEAAD